MSIKVGIIVGDPKTNFLSKLTKIFTKCEAYHCVFVDEESMLCYDMYWLRRRRVWPKYTEQQVILFDIPWVTKEYLEHRLSTDESEYGFLDYIQFLFRPLYHFFGKSTKNAGGVICSEMVNSDIIACGGTTPFDPNGEPPSPCDVYNWLLHRTNID